MIENQDTAFSSERRTAHQPNSPPPDLMTETPLANDASNGQLLDQVINRTSCPNCGHERDSDFNFCSSCGQKKISSRISFGRLLKEIPQQFFQFDRGLLLTIVMMFRNPGGMAREYVYGKRKTFVNPFPYFLLGASSQLFSLWFTADHIRKSFAESINSRKLPNQEQLEKIFEGDVANAMSDIYLASIVQSYTYAAALFFALPLAFCLWQSQRIVGSKYQYGEVLVFAFYITGHLLLMTSIAIPIAVQVNSSAATFVGPAVYLAFILFAHSGFFGSGIMPRFLSFAAMVVSMIVFFVSIFAIFIGSLLATVAFKATTG